MMKKQKELTIIIPCYNVQKYINKCLDSIKMQLSNIKYEIILIDDCSYDDTKKIIKKRIEKNDLNIVFIENKENVGAGASRNKAIKKAKYDYISFIDADDYLDDNYYEEMLSSLDKKDADVVVCDINMISYDKSENMRYCTCENPKDRLSYVDNGFAASPCNKIIKKEFLIRYPFAEGIMNEDIASIIAILINCNNVIYTSKTTYNYLQHEGSVQNSSLSNKRLDLFESINLLNTRIKQSKNYEKYFDVIVYNQVIKFLMYVPVKEKSIISRYKFLKKFCKYLKQYNIINNNSYQNYINTKGKKIRIYYNLINWLLYNKMPLLTSILMSIYNKYISIRNKNGVIKQNITIDNLVMLAKKNQNKFCKKTISVIIPNYNYDKFLYERFYSILNQNYKINEIIVLDDASTDDSIATIDEIVHNLSPYINISKYYNKINSGSPFKQWKRGIELSTSDYIWICEADDYCNKKLLSSLMKIINHEDNISIAYVDTAFINQKGAIIKKTIKPEIDILKSGHWNNSYVIDGMEEISKYAYLNCTIANVSSCLFKNQDYCDIFNDLSNFRQVGDYLFYLNLMKKGKVAFVNKTLNYYRVHGNNVTSTTKKQRHFEELKIVHKMLDSEIKLNKTQKENIKNRYEFLNRVWNLEEK